jgi:glycosyltransferase involved in cell wall biosynthesis
MKNKILIHPDLFYTEHSGSIAAREAAKILHELGNDIGVFTHDQENSSIASYSYYKRIPYNWKSNYYSKKYIDSFLEVIEDFKPNSVFFIGAIINTPLVYLDICHKNNIKTVFLLLTQDFYCARLHAGLGINECTKCLDNSNISSFIYNCGEKQNNPLLYLFNYQINQVRFLKRIKEITYVLGSSNDQLDYYRKVGVKEKNLIKIPLFFDQKRLKDIKIQIEPYFIIIGQVRHEKGIHLISKILNYINDGISVKLLLQNQIEADLFLKDYPENISHIQNKKLEIYPGLTMTNGAIELIAASKGVINPSIWATTTEFVLLETLGMSKPTICFNVGVHKELIINRINGISVNVGQFDIMGEEINNLNIDTELYEKISINAKMLYDELTNKLTFNKILKNIFN